MYTKKEARRIIKRTARRVLNGKYLNLISFTLPAIGLLLLVRLVSYYMSPSIEVDVSRMDNYKDFFKEYLSIGAAGYMAILLVKAVEILVEGPLDCSLSKFFLNRTSIKAINAENARPIVSAAPKLPPASQNFKWYLEPELRDKAILLKLTTTLLRTFWRLLLAAPPVILLIFIPNLDVNGQNLMYLWFIVGYIASEVIGGGYFPAPYILVEEAGSSIRSIIKDSVLMMKKHKFEYFLYELSFIPWYLATYATLGLLLVYFLPYKEMCDAMFVRSVDMSASDKSAAGVQDENAQA